MNKGQGLANWKFEVEEITAGMYRIRGTRNTGNQVERTSSDPECALVDCKRDAQKLEKEILLTQKARREQS